MNPLDWTNAVKAGIVAAVNAALALALATAVMLGWHPDINAFSVFSASLDAFINAVMALWVVFTYKDSPTRATTRTLRDRSGARGLTS